MSQEQFTYRVTDGWIRDLASEPTPADRWPCIRWDDQLRRDQERFLDGQAELDITYHAVWGLFISWAWPVPFKNIIDDRRKEYLKAYVESIHRRKLKLLAGVGIYSWGFEEIIRQVPGVTAGRNLKAMCAHSDTAWEWQKRVLDFLMDPQWGLDGISLQSADLGRCDCEKCSQLSPAQHHAEVLVRSADYVRSQRPEWTIGQASWGLFLDEPSELEHLKRISGHVDYMVEVIERTARSGVRKQVVSRLACPFGSVGGMFVEPPQHWERLRWFVPCGLGSAKSLKDLWADGGRACEYFFRPFANPAEEVSWRTGARILSAPATEPEEALAEAVSAVYGVQGKTARQLADWYDRGEQAYFSRSNVKVGDASLSLEPLVWPENPSVPGPPQYVKDHLTVIGKMDYVRDLKRLKAELAGMDIPNQEAVKKTLAGMDGTINECEQLLK